MTQIDMPLDYTGTYQKHMPKLANIIPSWKTILWTIQNDLLHEFATDFDRVLLQLVGTDIVNTV